MVNYNYFIRLRIICAFKIITKRPEELYQILVKNRADFIFHFFISIYLVLNNKEILV